MSRRAGSRAASSAALHVPKWAATHELLGHRGCSVIHRRWVPPAPPGRSPDQSIRRGTVPTSATQALNAARIELRSQRPGLPGRAMGLYRDGPRLTTVRLELVAGAGRVVAICCPVPDYRAVTTDFVSR